MKAVMDSNKRNAKKGLIKLREDMNAEFTKETVARKAWQAEADKRFDKLKEQMEERVKGLEQSLNAAQDTGLQNAPTGSPSGRGEKPLQDTYKTAVVIGFAQDTKSDPKS